MIPRTACGVLRFHWPTAPGVWVLRPVGAVLSGRPKYTSTIDPTNDWRSQYLSNARVNPNRRRLTCPATLGPTNNWARASPCSAFATIHWSAHWRLPVSILPTYPTSAAIRLRSTTAAESHLTNERAVPAAKDARTNSSGQCVLRIVHVNDVYLLGQLPRFKTLLDRERAKPGLTVSTLAGDFIMPSVLSGLDRGSGMVDVLNAVGLDLVCFGNHECDIPNVPLIERIKESQFVWINSNMRDFPHPCPEYLSLRPTSDDGSHRRTVAVLGVCIPLEKSKFGGAAATMETPNECVRRLGTALTASAGCDAIVPLTHQNLRDDVELAATPVAFDMPVVLGGHDHGENYTEHSGRWVIKCGANAFKACVVELTWESAAAHKATVMFTVVDLRTETPDPLVQDRVDRHMTKVRAMDHLFLGGPGGTVLLHGQVAVLSSQHTRFQPTTVGTFFAKAVRMMQQTDCCLLEAGSIKGETNYAGQLFNMAALRRELPYDSEVVTVRWTGRMVTAVIEESRALAGTGKPTIFFQQVDDGIRFDVTGRHVTHIAGEPVTLDREYTCSVFWESTFRFRANVVIREWVEDPANAAHVIANPEDGIPIKVILLQYFARSLWQRLPPFDEIDTDGNGTLSADEVKAAYVHAFATQYYADGKLDQDELQAIDAAVELLMSTLESDGMEGISREEYASLACDGIEDDEPMVLLCESNL